MSLVISNNYKAACTMGIRTNEIVITIGRDLTFWERIKVLFGFKVIMAATVNLAELAELDGLEAYLVVRNDLDDVPKFVNTEYDNNADNYH